MTPDEAHLNALLGSAGKRIASQPGAKDLVERIRTADSSEDLASFLRSVDLGLEPPARDAIVDAAESTRWREVHATLVRSAEQQLIDRFSASS